MLSLQFMCAAFSLLHKLLQLCIGSTDGFHRHIFAAGELNLCLHSVLREAGIPKQPLKAMVTPTNWHWKVGALLSELQQEQEIMGEIIKLKNLRDSMPMPAFTDIPAMKARMQAEVQLSGGEDVTVETVRAAYAELQKFLK